MRRVVALVSVAMLLAALLPATVANAADSTHLRLTRTGATASFAEVQGGLWVFTEISASSEASRDVVTGPLVWINQFASELDENGEPAAMVWSIDGSTTDFSMTIAAQQASATVNVPAMPVDRCDAFGSCEQQTIQIDAAFAAMGPVQHSHQRAIGAISHQSKFLYNNVGSYRFATATVTVDGVGYGPSTGPSDADIYDTKTGTIDVNLAKPGHQAALPAGVTVYDTTETPTGRRVGQSMFANWLSESDGVGRNTLLAASSNRVSTKGTVINLTGLGYDEQVYTIDENGDPTIVSDTFSGDSGTATTVAVDKFLDTGTLVGATIPVTSCTYIDDEVLCVDSVVQASGQWTGVGALTKTYDGSTAGTAGMLVIIYHNQSWHRSATATATIDGVTFSGLVEAFVDRSTTGFHEVHHGF